MVLGPFTGTETTLVAALASGRNMEKRSCSDPGVRSRGRNALDLDLIRLLHGLGQVIVCLEPVPGICTSSERFIEANGHLRGNAGMTVHKV